MTVTTVAVTCRASLQNGEPVPGAIFTFKLDRMEVSSDDDSVVAPDEVTVVADEDGMATWQTWPNELGTQGSAYRARAVNPATGKRFLNSIAVVPNADCDLEDCLELEAFPPLVSLAMIENKADRNKANVFAGNQSTQPVSFETTQFVNNVISQAGDSNVFFVDANYNTFVYDPAGMTDGMIITFLVQVGTARDITLTFDSGFLFMTGEPSGLAGTLNLFSGVYRAALGKLVGAIQTAVVL